MTGTGECTSWRGHRFEGRYSLGAADLASIGKYRGFGLEEVLEKMRTQTYERDVCVRCGATIEKHTEVSGSPQPLTP